MRESFAALPRMDLIACRGARFSRTARLVSSPPISNRNSLGRKPLSVGCGAPALARLKGKAQCQLEDTPAQIALGDMKARGQIRFRFWMASTSCFTLQRIVANIIRRATIASRWNVSILEPELFSSALLTQKLSGRKILCRLHSHRPLTG
jgi:hypothetical protein